MLQRISTKSLCFASCLILLIHVHCKILLRNISPVYGSIPAHTYWGKIRIEWIATVTCTVFDVSKPTWFANLVAIQLSATPLILKYGLFHLSSKLGPTYGSVATIIVICLPPCMMSYNLFAHIVSERNNRSLTPTTIWPAFLFVLCHFGLARILEHLPLASLSRYAQLSYVFLHSFGLLHVSALAQILLFRKAIPRAFFRFTIAIWLLTLLDYGALSRGTHISRVKLQRLSSHGYVLLAAEYSTTGYISVLENTQDRFRVLRNDHSLLGGVWLPDPQHGVHTYESVYPVFNMLEAVRLMQSNGYNESVSGSGQNALVIGLGAGTAPSALAQHSIQTYVVEIDPAVIRFAKEFFSLHKEVININEDAVPFVTEAKKDGPAYDYIIHDVFTGGAEPPELFTVEFLQGLKILLKSSGSIAINYAGDINHPLTMATLDNIMSTFHQCRIFRDSDPQESGDKDIINMVAFCRKDGGQWSFRQADEADFLGSEMRRRSIPPRFEIDVENLKGSQRSSVVSGDVSRHRLESALDHWKIMRQVLPDAVWENF